MYTRLSLLGHDCAESLRKAAEALSRLSGSQQAVDEAVAALSHLPAGSVPRAEGEIRFAADWWLPLRRHTSFFSFLAPRPARLLPDVPRAELLFLFHGNGHIREEALRRIEGPLPSAFFAVALAWRLNDWVPQVRAAAVEAVARTYPSTCAEILAEAASTLLIRRSCWSRWQGEDQALDQLCRADVAGRLADILAARPQGPMARILAQALRWPFLDDHLLRLSRQAVQPAVRALALEVLLAGSAKWTVGRERRWVDKSSGASRWVPTLAERPVVQPAPRRELLMEALCDSGGRVRLVAARALVAETESWAASLLRELASDPVRSVRQVAKSGLERREEGSGANA